MITIKLNSDFVATDDVKQTGKYLFDVGDGTPAIELVVWLEKSKATDKHPDGKPWIKLPKGNPTNRAYFSEDLFLATAVDGAVVVETKTTPPRVLGASGVKQDIVKYLSDEEAAEYTKLVNNAVELFKTSKASRHKKPEEMTVEELEAYIQALQTGTKVVDNSPKVFLDVLSESEYDRYNELLAIAASNKANAPKAPRRALTEEEKARAAKRLTSEISKAEALLEAMLAQK